MIKKYFLSNFLFISSHPLYYTLHMKTAGKMEEEMLKHKRLFVSDMDGTFYLGEHLLPGSLDFARAIYRHNSRLVFLTNNSSRTPEEYIRKLVKMGIERRLFEVYTSGEATVSLLKNCFPGKKVYLLSTHSVRKMFLDKGIVLDESNPDVLVLTYDTEITYEKIRKAALFIRRGVPYIASHPDINCPTEEGPVPDVGSLISLFETSTGRKPDQIVGKPDPTILNMVMKDFGCSPEETVMVGDRLYTDIECGLRAGVDTYLVLSGETTEDMIPVTHSYRVVQNTGSLAAMIDKDNTV